MRNSLFLKVYLTLIASLAIVALASAIFVRIGQDEEDRGFAGRLDGFLESMLPADASPDEQAAVLQSLSQAFDADIALLGPGAMPIATAGRPLPPKFLDLDGSGRKHSDRYVARLSGDRTLVARVGRPFGPGDGRRRPLAYLVLIALVTAAAAYPVVRHLHRRLERLRRGVERFGDGALDARAEMRGKDEIAAVAAAFNRAAERVERLILSNRALLANASHELRSPLARLRMAADLYQDRPDEATRTEIVRNLGELDGLVEEILLASRLDHVSKLDRLAPVDLLAVVAEEGALSGVAVSGEACIVAGDARLLARLARNLIQNAERHGAPPIIAEVRSIGRVVELSVTDSGAGIAQGEGDRLFEPFYRPAGRSEAAGGWGLGLSLVRQIARHHGGDVRHATPETGGARFVVTLPAYAPKA